MLAFLTRRKNTTPVDTAETANTAQQPTDDVVMRFLTQGGATIELHRQDYCLRTMPGNSVQLMPNNETRISHGFNWRCLGCDAIGGGGKYGLNERHFDEYRPNESRTEANEHAANCRAMPKPTT